MKAMKLYDRVERIHNELALLDLDGAMPLTVEQLTPFDQYHYFGTDAVDEAIAALGLRPGMRVLDVGSGIGGPARYIAARSGAHVTALELQPDLDALAADLTQRCGLADLVEHRCGNILDGIGEAYDAVISFLCFLHIGDTAAAAGRAAATRWPRAAACTSRTSPSVANPRATRPPRWRSRCNARRSPRPSSTTQQLRARGLRRRPHRRCHVSVGRVHRIAVGGVPRRAAAQRCRSRASTSSMASTTSTPRSPGSSRQVSSLASKILAR